MDRQRLVDIAADAIREDLLEPLGLKAPFVPVDDGWGIPNFEMRLANGVTNFDREANNTPVGISVAYWIDDDVKVASVLAHEMLHSALPHGEGHGKTFAKYHKAIGLTGKPTMSVPGPQFIDWFNRRIKPALA